MTCAESRELLQDALDDRIEAGARAALDDHLADCADCRAFEHDMAEMRRLFEQTPPVSAPPELAAAVMSRLPAGRVARLPRWVAPLTAAAAVVVALLVIDGSATTSQRPTETADAPTAVYVLDQLEEQETLGESARYDKRERSKDREVAETKKPEPRKPRQLHDEDDLAPAEDPAVDAGDGAPADEVAGGPGGLDIAKSKKRRADPGAPRPESGGPSTGGEPEAAGPAMGGGAAPPVPKPGAPGRRAEDAEETFDRSQVVRRVVLRCASDADALRLARALAALPEARAAAPVEEDEQTGAKSGGAGEKGVLKDAQDPGVRRRGVREGFGFGGDSRQDDEEAATLGKLARRLAFDLRSSSGTWDAGTLLTSRADEATDAKDTKPDDSYAGHDDDAVAEPPREPAAETADKAEQPSGATERRVDLPALDALLALLARERGSDGPSAPAAGATAGSSSGRTPGPNKNTKPRESGSEDDADEAPPTVDDHRTGRTTKRAGPTATKQDLRPVHRLRLPGPGGKLIEIEIRSR